MKRFQYIFIVILISLVGCDDDLIEVDDPNNVTDEYYFNNNTQEAYNYFTNDLYDVFMHIYGNWAQYEMATITRTDHSDVTNNGASWFGDIAQFTAPASETFISRTWRRFFEMIHISNYILEKSKEIEIPENEDLILGQVYFFRGYAYYKLATIFGPEIPLYDYYVTDPDEYQTPPTNAEKLWAQVERDLIEAKKLLPTNDELKSMGASHMGRTSKGAAAAFLAKSYLWRYYMNNESDLLDLAEAELKEIIDQEIGTYELVDNFRNNFLDDEVASGLEYNSESVFEVSFSSKEDYGNSNWEARGRMAGFALGYGDRWYNVVPNQKLIDEFEDMDPRKYMTCFVPNGAFFLHNSDSLYWEDVSIFQKGDDPRYAFRKYEYDASDLPRNFNNGNNRRVIRYSEILLLYAEIMNIKGDGMAAAQYVNMVRKRANNIIDEQSHLFYSKDYTGIITPEPGDFNFIPPVEDLMAERGWTMEEAIQHERIVEFAGEEIRWFDLIRFGKDYAEKNIKATLEGSSFNYERNMYWPIPQLELDQNREMKPNSAN